MTSDEFRALLSRNRERAVREWAEAWLDANGESREDTIRALASLATYNGIPRIDLGDDEDLAGAYDELVDNDAFDFGLGLVDESTGGIVAYFDDETRVDAIALRLNRAAGDPDPDIDAQWWVTDLDAAEEEARDAAIAGGKAVPIRDGSGRIACYALAGAAQSLIRAEIAKIDEAADAR